MNKETNKIVQSLYLCSTNSREKMQQSLIENILYSIGDPLSENELLEFINTQFHIEIDKFEINEVIHQMESENILYINEGKLELKDESKQHILNNVVENNEIEINRKKNIVELLKTINSELTDADLKILSDTFNEYIYECFLEYGRNAIKIFMPFNKDINTNGNILKEKLNTLKTPFLQKAFSSLVTIYPDNLKKSELDYLENLAIKAEYFFSLGIPEKEFNKAQDLKLNGLIILIDTNFIYSILGLHSHRQNDSCNQIISLISEKKIDCRLVFIRKTLQELQNAQYDFEQHISTEDLTYNQIKSLLDSDTLNNYSKDYFEKKLIDPATPHPAEKIRHSQNILISKNIQVYNYSFPHLDDVSYINAKFEDYYDYINIKNEARVKHNLPELPQKADKKLEHDIYLREAIISLRKDKNKINDLKYICLTLDKRLIEFDRFANGRKSKGSDKIAPNFMLPSIFLRKIRPFIPIITDDYKKAFISSITSNTLDTLLPEYSDAVQRSITYFKKLGIDDYDLIISIIKQELFFIEFIKSEKENKQEEFIRSEIDKAYEQLKIEKDITKDELKLSEKRRIEELKDKEQKINRIKNDFATAKDLFIQEKETLSNKIKLTKQDKEAVEKEKSTEEIKLKESLLREKQQTIADLSKKREPIEKQGDKAYSNYVFWYCLIIVVYFVSLAALTLKVGWNKMEPIIYFLGTVGIIASYIYPAIFGKNINPKTHFKEKRKELIDLKYSQFHFDIQYYNNLLIEKKKLEKEINKLKIAHNKKYNAFANSAINEYDSNK